MGTEALWVPLVVGAVTSVASAALAPKPAKAAEAPTLEKQPEAQVSKTADAAAYRKTNAASASATGQSSTLLTGLGGVDPTTINLGKNTLLGS